MPTDAKGWYYHSRQMDIAIAADRNLATNLRIARERMGISQSSLAEKMTDLGFKFHQTTINKIENNERKVSVSEAGALALLLDATVTMLMGDDPESPQWKSAAITQWGQSMLSVEKRLQNEARNYIQLQERMKQLLEEAREAARGQKGAIWHPIHFWTQQSSWETPRQLVAEIDARWEGPPASAPAPVSQQFGFDAIDSSRLEKENWTLEGEMTEEAFEAFTKLALSNG
ncbi:MAG: hypothetical protein JWP85_977 [Rhodoglobus sp.]|nr:hypothetical protein [Rhodoglobus sp.]